jgi:hypothetical protein
MSEDMLSALWRSVRIVLQVLWRLMRQLFYEATGVFFLLFAAWAGLAAWKQWKRGPAVWLLGFAISYAIMMAVFAVVSFFRARRVR